jgi:uncharacterized membrane protein SpoIIM required for sporulation/uncharacterized RDD family membrane protein YckC
MPSTGRRLRLETPEHVRIDYELADVGSRLAALLIDLAIIVFGLFLLVLGLMVLSDQGFSVVDSLAGGVILIALFVLQWGYFLLFELLRDGQTPGKRALRLRVRHSSGQPLSLRGSVIRNVVRVVDFQPGVTGVLGGAAIMLTGRSQRLGDIAADTVVVRDEGVAESVWPEVPEAASAGRPLLSAEQFELLGNYLRRRDDLSAEARRNVSGAVLNAVRPALNAQAPAGAGSADEFLLQLFEEEEPRRAAAGGVWGLQAAALVREQRGEWADYRELLHESRKGGLKQLPEGMLRRFGRLYRGITADLARARTYGAPAPVVRSLERWAGAGHNLLYRVSGESIVSMRRWITSGFPRAVRTHRRPVLLAALLLFGAMALSFGLVRANPVLARYMNPPAMLERAENTPRGDIDEAYVDIPGAIMPLASSGVITNNVRVALMAFAGGVLAGAGTVMLLVFNGVYLGSVLGMYANERLLGVILAFVFPHGFMELTAICLAGGAGLWLGSAILMPGRRTRRAALQERGREALSLLAGVVGLLVVAGIVEGFYSPAGLPAVAKFTFGSVTAVLLALYFAAAGRDSATAAPAP